MLGLLKASFSCLLPTSGAFTSFSSLSAREGAAGNGMIKITISCKHEIKKIDIDPSLLEDKEMLEDLIMVAFKDALGKVESTSSQKMGGLVPPGMNLPF